MTAAAQSSRTAPRSDGALLNQRTEAIRSRLRSDDELNGNEALDLASLLVLVDVETAGGLRALQDDHQRRMAEARRARALAEDQAKAQREAADIARHQAARLDRWATTPLLEKALWRLADASRGHERALLLALLAYVADPSLNERACPAIFGTPALPSIQ